MKRVITIRLDDDLEKVLTKVSQKLKRSRSDIVRDSLRRQLNIYQFEILRESVLPFGESGGYLTDDDIFREVS